MAHGRRTFLAALGGMALGASRAKALAALAGATTSGTKLSRIGIQLYTVRRAAAADLPGTLARLASIGFKEVELAGYYGHSATEFRDLLAANALAAPSGHIAIDLIETDPSKTFADAHSVGHEWITVPSLPRGRHQTMDDWKQVAARFNAAAARAKADGFRFAFHNHNDIVRTQNGLLPIDILMRETDPSLVFYQLDIYWAVSGGADPVALLARYPGRFKMLHVKDGKAPYTDASQTDLGQGTIDFRTIFAKAGGCGSTSAGQACAAPGAGPIAGIEHYFMESDSAADPLAFARAGYEYLAKMEY
jgi:sugar phosphate isomerase/epimerase